MYQKLVHSTSVQKTSLINTNLNNILTNIVDYRAAYFAAKKFWNDPLSPSSQPNRPGRQQDHRVVLHDQVEGYQQPITFKSGSRQVSMSVEEVFIYFLGGYPIPYIGLVPC